MVGQGGWSSVHRTECTYRQCASDAEFLLIAQHHMKAAGEVEEEEEEEEERELKGRRRRRRPATIVQKARNSFASFHLADPIKVRIGYWGDNDKRMFGIRSSAIEGSLGCVNSPPTDRTRDPST